MQTACRSGRCRTGLVAISTAPTSCARSRAAAINSSVMGCTPLSPWIGSSITAHISLPSCLKIARSSLISLGVQATKPPGSGRKLSCSQSCIVAAMVSSVRPWKPPRMHTMVLPPLPARLAYRRASFIEPRWPRRRSWQRRSPKPAHPQPGHQEQLPWSHRRRQWHRQARAHHLRRR